MTGTDRWEVRQEVLARLRVAASDRRVANFLPARRSAFARRGSDLAEDGLKLHAKKVLPVLHSWKKRTAVAE
jgi:hypothetical protein